MKKRYDISISADDEAIEKGDDGKFRLKGSALKNYLILYGTHLHHLKIFLVYLRI